MVLRDSQGEASPAGLGASPLQAPDVGVESGDPMGEQCLGLGSPVTSWRWHSWCPGMFLQGDRVPGCCGNAPREEPASPGLDLGPLLLGTEELFAGQPQCLPAPAPELPAAQ